MNHRTFKPNPVSPLIKIVFALLLPIIMSACGGGGGGSSQANAPSLPTDTAVPTGKVFALDTKNSAIAFTAELNPPAGTLVIDKINKLNRTDPVSIAYDKTNDRLYVGFATPVVLVFNNASKASGSVSPARTIELNQSRPVQILLDTVNDTLYVTDVVDHGIFAYKSISTANGKTTASRIISGNGRASGQGFPGKIAIDSSRNILYVANLLASDNGPFVSVYENLNTLSGAAMPNRYIERPVQGSGANHIALDQKNDSLYVVQWGVSSSGKFENWAEVKVYNSVSTASGKLSPSRTIVFPADITLLRLDDFSDRLYASNNHAVFILNSASQKNGASPVTQVTAPAGTLISDLVVSP